MKILLFEYITGGGLIDHGLSSSLVHEGEIMLKAVANDFGRIADVDVCVLRDYRLSSNSISSNDITISTGQTYAEVIDQLNKDFDALLIIAPESNNVLALLCEYYSNQDIILLNNNTSAIRLTSSKLDTYNYLLDSEIEQIPTFHHNQIKDLNADQYVIKPIDGAGCENLFILRSHHELVNKIEKHEDVEFIIQPYVKGTHASLSLICWDGEYRLLSANEQYIKEKQDSFVLKGCRVNAFAKIRFKSFCDKLIQALPGLRGYIGIDILITENKIILVEINPRITTSYVGLADALGVNPAELILECFKQRKIISFEETKNHSVNVKIESNRAA